MDFQNNPLNRSRCRAESLCSPSKVPFITNRWQRNFHYV